MKLYHHSILSSNRVQDNKLIKNACEKIVLNLFFKAQVEMKKEIENTVNSEFTGTEREELLKALFTGKVGGNSCELELLKDSMRERAVEKYSKNQNVNLSKLAKENGINITKIREELYELSQKTFVFNFINRKKLPVELVSPVITGAEFSQTEKGLIFNYEIPKAILNFLIFPDQYAPVDMEIVKNLKSKYAIKLYLLVIDHKKRGVLEVTKNELVECFSLPHSYSKNRKIFLNKFLIPAITELEKVAKLKLSYRFSNSYSFEEIILKIERENRVFSPVLLEKIAYTKRNIYISKAWDVATQEFLLDYYNENGEEKTKLLLQNVYDKLNESIKTTLANYFFMVSKKLEVEFWEQKSKKCVVETEENIKSESPRELGKEVEMKISSWENYQKFCEREKKIYKNLARLLFEEKLGLKNYPEKAFDMSFKSLVAEILEA